MMDKRVKEDAEQLLAASKLILENFKQLLDDHAKAVEAFKQVKAIANCSCREIKKRGGDTKCYNCQTIDKIDTKFDADKWRIH